jgi:hypothetical protein
MNTQKPFLLHRRNMQIFALGLVAVVSSFAIGVQTTGDVQPVSLIRAGSIQLSGDMNEDGSISVQDALIILEIAQGYTRPTPSQIMADPNGDGNLTVDDAIRVLSGLLQE